MVRTQEPETVPVYQIGGRRFTAPPVVAWQEKQLWPLVKPLFMKGESITAEDVFALMGDSITRLAAIVLVADGQTQAQKVRAGLDGLRALDAWLEETVSVVDLGPVIADFFGSGQQWKILAGLAGPLRSRMTTGSTTPSVSSPTATLGAPPGSGVMSDLATPGAISSAPESAAPPSAPSLVSVA